jgi:hypothetical protein
MRGARETVHQRAFSSVLEALWQFTPAELDELHAKIQVLRATASQHQRVQENQPPQAAREEIMLFDALSGHLSQVLRTRPLAYRFFCGTANYVQFQPAATHALTVMHGWLTDSGITDPDSMRRLIQRCARMVVRDFLQQDTMLYWNRISSRLSMIEVVFEHCFPGYLRSGLVVKVLLGDEHARHESTETSDAPHAGRLTAGARNIPNDTR